MDSGSDNRELDEEREELFFLVWSMPSWQVAEKLGVSAAALRKRCSKLGIPRPPRGYWTRFNGNSDRPAPPVTAYLDVLRGQLNQKVIRPGLHLSERKKNCSKRLLKLSWVRTPSWDYSSLRDQCSRKSSPH